MRFSALLLALMPLAACVAPTPPNPPTASDLPITPARGVRITDGADIRIAAGGDVRCAPTSPAEIAVAISATNAFRRSKGLPPVVSDPAAQRAAEGHACEMASRGTMTHYGETGPMGRLKKAGFKNPAMVAENVAAGMMSDQVVLATWAASPKHGANMSYPEATHFGYAKIHDGRQGFWVALHAARRR